MEEPNKIYPRTKREPYQGRKSLQNLYPHVDNCGHCHQGRIMHRLFFSTVHPIGGEELSRRSDIAWRIWERSKYSKFAKECRDKGLDFQVEFKKRGWEP